MSLDCRIRFRFCQKP